jgi:hypothetical protein
MKATLALLTVVTLMAGAPMIAEAGHGHHGGGGYGGGCACGGQVQYAPPLNAQYGEPTPAVAARGSGYQSFSYSPTPAGQAVAPAPIMAGNNYQSYSYQSAPSYGGAYGYGYRQGRQHAYENAANKSLGRVD